LKQYTITGERWDDHHLELQQSGIPVYWVNSNNKYGPWKSPYVTIHEGSQNGLVVAAAKMAYPGWKRDFKVYQGNPDCTDLSTWPVVKCLGKWAHEYRFVVEVDGPRGQLPLRFAWRRTRDKNLGASKKSPRDFKLVALDSPSPPKYEDLRPSSSQNASLKAEVPEVNVLDLDMDEFTSDEKCSIDELDGLGQVPGGNVLEKNERVIGVYVHESKWSATRQARVNLFESLPLEVELRCLTVLMGLQEKISRNKDAFTVGSAGYGGGLRPLGNYI
jgi:hypothetical protein